jgi:hypothetical protein
MPVVVDVTSCQLFQFYGALSFSSDALMLRQLCGATQLYTLTRVLTRRIDKYFLSWFFHCWFAFVNRACSWLYWNIGKILSKKSWLDFSPKFGVFPG